MKATAKLENVMNLVQEMSANHFDQTVPVKALEFESLNQVWIDNVSVEVSPTAQPTVRKPSEGPLLLPRALPR